MNVAFVFKINLSRISAVKHVRMEIYHTPNAFINAKMKPLLHATRCNTLYAKEK